MQQKYTLKSNKPYYQQRPGVALACSLVSFGCNEKI